jgi:hypothetical protein
MRCGRVLMGPGSCLNKRSRAIRHFEMRRFVDSGFSDELLFRYTVLLFRVSF